MDFNAIIKRVINIITKPNEEWDTIQNETLTMKDIYFKFGIILYAIPPIALLIGMIISGAPIIMSLTLSIFFYVIAIGIIYLIGILIDVIGAQFGGTKDMLSSQKLAIFSFIPFALIGVLFILPIGRFYGDNGLFYLIMLLSLYSIYLMYLGAPKLKNISMQDKLMPFIFIMAIIWLILIYIDFRISSRVAVEIYLNSFSPVYNRF